MNTAQTVLDGILYRNVSKAIPADFEPDLIEAAKAGNDQATITLLEAYGPAIRTAVRLYPTVDPEDARSAVLEGFYNAVYAYEADRGTRLAATLPYALREALGNAAAEYNTFHVPLRTVQRFFDILRKAQGDLGDALVMAPTFGMTAQTFLDVHRAVTEAEALDVLFQYDADDRAAYLEINAVSLTSTEPVGEDESHLLAIAWDAVDETQEKVCRLYYGFEDGDPLPDAEIGHRLGMTRPKTQRVRAKALDQMREALGLETKATKKEREAVK